ncbi:MAG: type II toxin-antitoxin system PemK/MazF family toxin [Acidobacteria bacterium]|nr:type II toxin-antitoxin system PemK/MazF family toxin [Acidobacteriota bacterium]
MRLARGTVIAVDLDPTIGHEQRGLRPCIVVSDPDISSDQRFPLIGIVPVTGTPGQGLLYPPLAPGPSGLAKLSYALIDHIRSIDKRRVHRLFGVIPPSELAAIDTALSLFLGLHPSQ